MRRDRQDVKYIPYYETLDILEGEMKRADIGYSVSEGLRRAMDLIENKVTVIDMTITTISK